MIQPNDFDEFENEELDHLIDQFIDLHDDFVGNAHLIISVCERALPLARMEKKWYLFFVLYDSLFLHVIQYGDSRKAIKYAQQFFLDCAAILPEAAIQYSHTHITETAVNCFGRIFSTYSSYHQITDQKLEEFIHFYEETARRYGQEFTFWRDILDYGLDIVDLDTAKKGYAGIKAHPLKKGTTCYICTTNQTLGYFVLTGQHEEARALVNNIIHKRIPAKYKSSYDDCPAANSACQYDRLLDFYANFGEVGEYNKMLETGAAQMENYHERYGMSAGMAYHLANSGRFPYIEEYLEIFSNTVDKLEHGGRTYHLMGVMIRWSIYFQKLNESGVHQVKLTCDSPTIPDKDPDGLISLKSLSVWCDSTADWLGAQFEAVRERFHYEAFKNNHKKCAGLPM